MARILYFDCFSGLSGDMALGALLDAGMPLDALTRALGTLALGDAHVHATRVVRAGVSATKFSVHEHAHDHAGDHQHNHRHDHHHDLPHDDHGHAGRGEQPHAHPHRTLDEINALIDRSSLSAAARARAKAMFQRLGEAEAAIHAMPIERVHLHEVGALDSIIDIAGIAFAMEWAGADRVVCSPLNVGGGMVRSAHGVFPVPAPATLRLLGGAPVYSGRVQTELVTPTGALIATTFASEFGPIPAMTIERVGYGAGDRDDPETPNVLRVLIGRAADAPHAAGDRVTVIECEIDDMNPQLFGVVMDRLYAAGALEVFYTPVQMKKNRPGTLLTVVAAPPRSGEMADIVFRETTTIGLRRYDVDRECLQREIVTVETPIGAVRFKVARRGGHVVNAAPEFEDLAALAREKQLSVKDVQAIAIAAYGART
ncbi:MAG: nickel pincer cofactor biosynthesis protein LarC [Acidobacteria bacterium]|nr:MAG: nickel pincer cofactor biosynthesis protein LarC [Acidobacteriota bacterium]